MPVADNYFIAWKGQRDGPYTLAQLESMLEKGEIGLLHRVETSSGPVPLKQILLEANPARWNNASGPNILGAPEAPPLSKMAAPVSPTPVKTADAMPVKADDTMLVYAICGMCFLIPPLVFLNWSNSKKIAARGEQLTADRVNILGSVLAGTGVLFWVLLYKFW